MNTFSAPLVNLKSSVWSHGIIVPISIAKQFLKLNDKRVVCILNNKEKIHAALMPKGDEQWFINLNQKVQKSIHAKEGDQIEVSIQTDNSKYGMDAPEEFMELLKQDSKGKIYFEALSMGKQRTLLHMVLKVKNSNKRIEKSITILEYLKDVKGELDFKAVNNALKNSRY